MMTPYTAEQKQVLKYMNDNNIGAVAFNGKYRFPQEFRDDAKLAADFAAFLNQGYVVDREGFITK